MFLILVLDMWPSIEEFCVWTQVEFQIKFNFQVSLWQVFQLKFFPVTTFLNLERILYSYPYTFDVSKTF